MSTPPSSATGKARAAPASRAAPTTSSIGAARPMSRRSGSSSTSRNDPDALPPVLDVEWNGHSRTCPQKIDRSLALEKIQLMLTELEQLTGKKPVIYTDITFHKDVLEGEFNDYPYWIRSTAAKPETRYDNRPWAFWQFTTTGRVPGIKGDVDRNAFFGDEGEFVAWLQGRIRYRHTPLGEARAVPPQPSPGPERASPPPAVVATIPGALAPVALHLRRPKRGRRAAKSDPAGSAEAGPPRLTKAETSRSQCRRF